MTPHAFAVVLAFAVNLVIRSDLNLSALVILLILILLILCILLSVKSEIWSKRLRFITDSWTSCIVILGLSWILLELLGNSDSKVIKGGVVLIYIFVVLLISFMVQRTIRIRTTHSSSTKSFVFLVPAILVILGFCFFLKQEPLRNNPQLLTRQLNT